MLRRFHGPLKSLSDLTLKQARRLVAIVIGLTLVLMGIVLLFVPGPGAVTIYAGIAILATELVWARILLRRINQHAREIGNAINNHARSFWPNRAVKRQPQRPVATPAADCCGEEVVASEPRSHAGRPGNSSRVPLPNFLDQDLSDRMVDEGCPNS